MRVGNQSFLYIEITWINGSRKPVKNGQEELIQYQPPGVDEYDLQLSVVMMHVMLWVDMGGYLELSCEGIILLEL